MDDLVRAERAAPSLIFQGWRAARRAAVGALRGADPGRPVSWVEAPLKPATMAPTRLAEHWARGLDITGPLGIPFPDTDRLRHVAWLAHRSLPYAFALAGAGTHDVACDLTAPGGTDRWRFGPEDAGSRISRPGAPVCPGAGPRPPPPDSMRHTPGP